MRAQELKVAYLCDDLGRLKQVIDQNGDAATYNYDAVGNILSIERGGGTCPAAAPVITVVSSESCYAGARCQITLDGTSLLGAGVSAVSPSVAVSDCRTDCNQIRCIVSPSPSAPVGSASLTITTPLGSAQANVDILPPPSVGGAGETSVWHFTANVGDAITLAMTRITNQPDGSSTLDPGLELLDSRGFLVASDDDSGSKVPRGPGRNALIRNLTLPATDTYTLIARGVGGTYGPYILDIMPPTIALLPGLVITPQPNERQFAFTGTISHIGERDTFTFAGNLGERATIDVRRTANNPDGTGTLDPAVDLRDSRGVFIAADSDGGLNVPQGPGRNALLANLLLQATDTYRVIVTGEAGTLGPYEITIRLRAP